MPHAAAGKALPKPAALPMPAHMQPDFAKKRYVPPHVKHDEYVRMLYAKRDAAMNTPEERRRRQMEHIERDRPAECAPQTPAPSKLPPTARIRAEAAQQQQQQQQQQQSLLGSWLGDKLGAGIAGGGSFAPGGSSRFEHDEGRIAPPADAQERPKTPKAAVSTWLSAPHAKQRTDTGAGTTDTIAGGAADRNPFRSSMQSKSNP